ncbi:MAG: hypothetical protein ABJJ44_18845 [Paraglaciecola sp.]|uniref:hypothetical protein n=1 Tax=Paraglaciecola sp. TaxID=1920173 RepID=UPI003296B98F
MIRFFSLIVLTTLFLLAFYILNRSDVEDVKVATLEVKEKVTLIDNNEKETSIEPALKANINVLDDYVNKCVGDIENESIEASTEVQDTELLRGTLQNKFLDAFSTPLEDGNNRINALIQYGHSFPEDELIKTEIAIVCSKKPNLKECSQELFNDIALDSSSDGEIWSYIANFHAGNNDDENTLKALNRALESNYYGNSFGESISRVVFELSGENSGSLHASLTEALKLEATNAPSYHGVIKFCEENIDDVYISSICFRFGQDLVSRGKNHSLFFTGMGLMRMMVDIGPFETSQIRIPEQYQTHLKMNSDYKFHQASRVMKFNDDLLLSWIHNLEKSGELKASIIIVNEVIKLAETRNFKYCKEQIN